MAGDREHVYRQTMAEARQLRIELSRRRVLQLMGVGAAGLAAGSRSSDLWADDTHGPGWYTDDKLKGNITVYTFSGQRWGLPTNGVLPTYKERFPNVNVKITEIPISEGITKLMLLASSNTSELDVVLTHAGVIQGVYNLGAAEVLTPYLEKDPGWLKDYVADVNPQILNNYRIPQKTEGQQSALPFDGNAHVMWYRKDLFEEAGLPVPRDWTQTLAASKALNHPEKDQYGFVCFARRGLYSALSFQQIFFTLGGRIFDATEKGGWHPQLNNDKGRQALEILKELMQYAHPVSLNAVDDEVQTALANGTAAFAPWSAATPILNDPKFTKFHEVFVSDRTPWTSAPGGDVCVLAGFGMYVNARSESKQAAFEFLKHLCSGDYTDRRIGQAFVDNFGQPVRQSLLKEYTSKRPYFAGLQKTFSQNLVDVIPKIPEGVAVLEQIGNEVSAYLVEGKSADAALAAMDTNVTDVMTEAGYYK